MNKALVKSYIFYPVVGIILYIFLISLTSLLNYFLFNIERLPSPTIVNPDYYKQPHQVIKIVLIIPILEEFAFRYHLIARNKREYTLSAVLLVFCMVVGFANYKLFSLLSLVLILVLVSIGFLLQSCFSNQRLDMISKFYDKNIIFMMIISSLMFGLYHCDEYFGLYSFDLIIFSSIPFLIVGLISAWIAIRTGKLGPSIFFHFLNNSLIILAATLKGS